MTTETDNAQSQAKAQLEHVTEMVARLSHTRECYGGEDCPVSDEVIEDALSLRSVDDADRAMFHNHEAAEQAIQEHPLSVETRSNWHTPGGDADPGEYAVLLCTGGPAVRIIGTLDNYPMPCDARLEYQDWGTPWTDYRLSRAEEFEVVSYASHFYYGE